MTERLRRILLISSFAAAAALIAYAAGVSPSALLLFAVMSTVSAWRQRKTERERAAFYGIVWELRRADRQTRERLLSQIEPQKLRDAIARVLERDGVEEQEGDVERFPYPHGLRRFMSRRYWVLWGTAALLLLLSAFSAMWAPLRAGSAALALVFGWFAWKTNRQEHALASVIEVTPFRVSECFPDGMRRTLSLRGNLVIRNEPRRQRLVISGGSDDAGIGLDYRRMGFERMCALVWEYGGFTQSDESSPAS